MPMCSAGPPVHPVDGQAASQICCHCAFGTMYGVAAVETGGKQGSPGALHLNFSNPSPPKAEKDQSERIGLFLAVLNLIYISIDAFENTKAKNTLSRNGFRVLNYAQSGLFCVRTKFISR